MLPTNSSSGADMVASNTTIMGGAPLNIRIISTTDSDLAADYQVNIPGSYHTWAPLYGSGPWLMQVATFRSAVASTVPFVTSVSPTSGPVGGGTAVTISGMDFAAGATVAFGGVAATNVVVVNSTTITATTPAGSAGPVTVTVTNPSGQLGNLADGFTYLPPPGVSSVSPEHGLNLGWDGSNDHGHELRFGSDGDVRGYGSDECSGSEQYDHHGDHAGACGRRGDGDGDQPWRTGRQPGQRLHVCELANRDQCQSRIAGRWAAGRR